MVREIHIRGAKTADLEEIVKIGAEAFPYIKDPERFFRQRLENGRIFVIQVDGKVIGFVDITPGDYAVIEGIAVKKEFRGRGFGARLLEYALQWLQRSGARGVILRTLASNARAVALYKKFGFRELWRDGEVILMGKSFGAVV